ncbi:MAG: von Willebrand factor type A domain-containing protein, partial [Deltaproteobacteria bacterium]|nr:von Willebrand factor type A domain-containing protein [Nannocystaceae bacterium]
APVRRPGSKRDTAASSTSTDPPTEPLPPSLPPAALTETYFKHYGVNPTIDTEEESVSSFALDVDTASYTLARGALGRDEMPDDGAIRVEEFLNAFDYGYPAPPSADFEIHTEVVPSPHRAGYHVLHVGLRAREIAGKDRAPANLVFVVDVSSSMAEDARLELVQDAMRALVQRLGAQDKLAIVSYGNEADLVLEPTAGDRHVEILAAIDALAPAGSTDVDAGLRLGYALAAKAPIEGGINRVLLYSDGVATAGPTAAEELLAHVADAAAKGITISTIGVGVENYDDVLLEQLADKGNGKYEYVDRFGEAERVLVHNLTGTLQVVARDAKLQVEFDPAVVARYRLLGYENRGLSPDAFSSANTDAGEIGAGHAVTALYELQLRPGVAERFGTVRLRYRLPHTGLLRELDAPLSATAIRTTLGEASPATRVSMVVAAFAEKLRGSYWVRELGWPDIQNLYLGLPADWLRRREVAELGELIDTAARLDRRTARSDRDFTSLQMDFDRMPVLQ